MNQHFVPKFVIEGFVNETESGNRGVWVYKASDRKWSKRPTRETAALEDFYTFIEANGEKDDTLERSMGKIEKIFSPVLRDRILKRQQIAPPQPFDALVTFCALLICRNPSTIARTGDVLVREAKAAIAEVITSEESFQKFRADLRERAGIDFPNIAPSDRPRLLTDFKVSATKYGAIGFSMLTFHALSKDLANMAVSFFHTSSEHPFITSDSPYAICPVQNAESFEIDQLVVPLSASVTAVFDRGEPPIYRHVEASVNNVKQVNAAILTSAREFLISRSAQVFPADAVDRWAQASQEDRVVIAAEIAGA